MIIIMMIIIIIIIIIVNSYVDTVFMIISLGLH